LNWTGQRGRGRPGDRGDRSRERDHPDLGLGERRSEFPTRAAWEAARHAPEPTQRDSVAPLSASATPVRALGSAVRSFSPAIDTRERRSHRPGG
jgi:hypothetical protein